MLMVGKNLAWISGAKVQVAHVMGLSCGQEEALVSFMPLGALSASLVAGKLINRYDIFFYWKEGLNNMSKFCFVLIPRISLRLQPYSNVLLSHLP